MSGFLGEQEYDAVGYGSLYVFRDIWLDVGDGKVQLDALIVNEIKNYSGNYSCEKGVWRVRAQRISEDAACTPARRQQVHDFLGGQVHLQTVQRRMSQYFVKGGRMNKFM